MRLALLSLSVGIVIGACAHGNAVDFDAATSGWDVGESRVVVTIGRETGLGMGTTDLVLDRRAERVLFHGLNGDDVSRSEVWVASGDGLTRLSEGWFAAFAGDAFLVVEDPDGPGEVTLRSADGGLLDRFRFEEMSLEGVVASGNGQYAVAVLIDRETGERAYSILDLLLMQEIRRVEDAGQLMFDPLGEDEFFVLSEDEAWVEQAGSGEVTQEVAVEPGLFRGYLTTAGECLAAFQENPPGGRAVFVVLDVCSGTRTEYEPPGLAWAQLTPSGGSVIGVAVGEMLIVAEPLVPLVGGPP